MQARVRVIDALGLPKAASLVRATVGFATVFQLGLALGLIAVTRVTAVARVTETARVRVTDALGLP